MKTLLKIVLPVIAFSVVVSLAWCEALKANSQLPDYVQAAPARVSESYQYAVDHPDHLDDVPCYCGCVRMGHTSNADCFVKARSEETGEIVYDNHAVGCGNCVDIAQDVIRLRAEGKTGLEVRTYIDATYSDFGPGTDTPMPVE